MHQCNEPKEEVRVFVRRGAVVRLQYGITRTRAVRLNRRVLLTLVAREGEEQARERRAGVAHRLAPNVGHHPPPHIITGQCLNTYPIARDIGKLYNAD